MYWITLTLPTLTTVPIAPLTGWIADAKYGYYKVLKVGKVALFFSTVLNCLVLILKALNLGNGPVQEVLWWIGGISAVFSYCAWMVALLPLGLDQMPDASSSNIQSFIAWYMFSILLGTVPSQMLNQIKLACLADETTQTYMYYTLIWAWLLALCMTITIVIPCTKQEVLLPKNSFREIYQVLKFAAKHKSPVNRSAFTYWEEDIPSRMDLGKSKYGGPFTIEQVENVKTALRLFVITLPIFLLTISLELKVSKAINNECEVTNSIINQFFTNSNWFIVIATVIQEFVVYPLSRKKLSIIRKIGVVSFMMILASFLYLILELINQKNKMPDTITTWVIPVIFNLVSTSLYQLFITSVTEFICAQTPYNMKGLFLSFATPAILTSYIVGEMNLRLLQEWENRWALLVSLAAKTLLISIGFVLFCVVARWYKLRVRDEEYPAQRVVEEVYDRYLTAARREGSLNSDDFEPDYSQPITYMYHRT